MREMREQNMANRTQPAPHEYQPDSAPVQWLKTIFSDAADALRPLSAAGRFIHIFYLLGPFILLIERSPADVWLSVCALTFFARCIIQRDWAWVRFFWVKAVLVFWVICLISASLSVLPAYSLGEAFIWIRFPLFAFASCFWLAQDRRILMAMLVCCGAGMIIMCGILTAELLIVGKQWGRLSWPYGDLTPGNYLGKACMPAFCMLAAYVASGMKRGHLYGAGLILYVMMISIFTGERINFLLLVCGGVMAVMVWRPYIRIFIGTAAAIIAASSAVFILSPRAAARFLQEFLASAPWHEDSPYMRVWNGAIEAFYTSPWLGIGPDGYRKLCPQITQGMAHIDCHTQPHQYYLQMLAETGIIGLLAGIVMIGAIIWRCFKIGLMGRSHLVSATAFVLPFGLFFPLQSTGDFFGQWNNIFLWSAVSFALACQAFIKEEHKKA